MAQRTRKTKERAKWEGLKEEALRWFERAFRKIRREKIRVPHSALLDFKVAEFVLLSAKEYAETAFEAFLAERWHSGLSCCRTIIEMSMTLLWCRLDDNKQHERLHRWVKTTVSGQHKIYIALRDTSDPKYKEAYKKAEERSQEQLEAFSNVKELPSYAQMMQDIEKAHPDPTQAKWLHAALYKQLCQSVHAQLAPDRFFDLVGTTEVRHGKPKPPPYRVWAAMSSIVWVVCVVYQLLGWDYQYFLDALGKILGDADVSRGAATRE